MHCAAPSPRASRKRANAWRLAGPSGSCPTAPPPPAARARLRSLSRYCLAVVHVHCRGYVPWAIYHTMRASAYGRARTVVVAVVSVSVSAARSAKWGAFRVRRPTGGGAICCFPSFHM